MKFDLTYLKTHHHIIGCDEVGRGPLAGPVVGCAVKINSAQLKKLNRYGLNDSKKLTDKKRQLIIDSLKLKFDVFKPMDHLHFNYCLWQLEPIEIDKINILNASLECMRNASDQLTPSKSDIILIDGNKTFEQAVCKIEAVVKGDGKSLAIGMASIIAKVYRDNLMKDYALKYPGYGLENHAGYPTKLHKEAISKLGITPIHRKSFKGVKEYL